MIKQSKYIPKQMNGPVINAEAESLEREFNNADYIINYLHGLSIATADETELENIGRIIGYVRPLVPEGFNAENILILGTLPLATDAMIGLSTVDSEIGGRLSTTQSSQTDYMALGTYRQFLEKIAILKRYGITLKSVDEIASLISNDYTISFDANKDIQIHYTNSIGYKNTWILTQVFYRIATEPQVLVSSGS